jgi:exoribonuclease-2
MVREKSVVVYKNRPALVTGAGEKIALSFLDGTETKELRVREKDIEVLFPGPVADRAGLERDIAALGEPADQAGGGREPDAASAGETAAIREAWELLSGALAAGASIPLRELAELAYGEYNPRSAWAAYLLLTSGLYFSGTIDGVRPRPPAEVEAGEKKREAKIREGRDRDACLAWLKNRRLKPAGAVEAGDDELRFRRFIQDVEALANGKSAKSRTMKDLGLPETPEDAHALLLDTGLWTPLINPHPSRFGLSLASAKIIPGSPPEEDRRDLTGLPAFAIDSPWSADPDDAVSAEGDTLYVHVADPAASIGPGSPAEREARDRGATLYLPEGAFRMLAEESLALFALGLAETSPALSFKMTLDGQGAIAETEIFPSRVRVTRLTYAQADEGLPGGGGAVLENLYRIADRNLKRRLAAGAVPIDLPETHIGVNGGKVAVTPIVPYRSAGMVRDCMLLAGEGAGLWAGRQMPGGRRLAFPYVSQEAGDLPREVLPGMAGFYQLRRCMRPRTLSVTPGRHWGLGLDVYTQVTSPLRRYTDLLAHLQIRALLRGEEPLVEEEVLARLGAGEAAAQAAAQAERASRAHWAAVYLSDKKDSVWDAVALEKKGPRWVFMIPALALETQAPLRQEVEPNDELKLVLKSVNIPRGETGFTLPPEGSTQIRRGTDT